MRIHTLEQLRALPNLQYYAPTWSEREQLPDSNLDFDNTFNESLDGVVFPEFVTSIKFGKGFNQPLTNVVFPSHLQHLHLGISFNQPLEGVVLPNSLEQFVIQGHFNHSLDGVVFPTKLQDFVLQGKFNGTLSEVMFPSGLSILELNCFFTGALPKLPDTVEYLVLSGSFNEVIDTFPAALNTLNLLGNNFNQPFDLSALPAKVTTLNFGERFGYPLTGTIIPKSLHTLRVGECYAQKFDDILLGQLKELGVSKNYQHLSAIREKYPGLKIDQNHTLV